MTAQPQLPFGVHPHDAVDEQRIAQMRAAAVEEVMPNERERESRKFDGPGAAHPVKNTREVSRREAHASITARDKERVWGKVMAYARECGERGFTADELAVAWDCSPNHVAPRVTELVDLGKLRPSGERRRTRSNRLATVLVTT